MAGCQLKVSLPSTNEQHGLGASRLKQGFDPLWFAAVQGGSCFDARLQKWYVSLVSFRKRPFYFRSAAARIKASSCAIMSYTDEKIVARFWSAALAKGRTPHTNFLTSESGFLEPVTDFFACVPIAHVLDIIEMEDAHTINLAMTKHNKKGFFGVYDGHNGDICAHWSAEHVWQYVDKLDEFTAATLKQACLEADKEFLEKDPDSYVFPLRRCRLCR